jgi:hypothetical protein
VTRRKPSSTAQLQAKTLKHAVRHGLKWDDSEVSLLANAIAKDDTTYDMALALGRSYYSVQGARAHVRFALDHRDALYGNDIDKKRRERAS